ncbi:MAG: hypothetical protein WBH29_04570 [Bacilli bacterium]
METNKMKEIKKSFWKSLLSLFFVLILSACVTSLSEISTHMRMTIKKEYLKQFLLPEDPDARLEEVEYHQFLRRFRDDKGYVYLIAWEVDEETEAWELEIGESNYRFEHEVRFIAYRSSTKTFHSLEEALELSLITIAGFEKALEKWDVFISESS